MVTPSSRRRRGATCRTRVQADRSTAPGADSRTSRSRSRSSRSSPAASRPTSSPGTTAARSRSRGAGRSSAGSSSWSPFSMSELVSKYPTAGGIYYWASDLGGKRLGVVHRLVQPDRPGRHRRLGRLRVGAVRLTPCSRSTASTSASSTSATPSTCSPETFALFALFLVVHSLINIYSSPLVALFNNVSVCWHVLGVAVIIVILIVVPDNHQSVDFVFTQTYQQLRLQGRPTSGGFFWFYVLPLGFLLTMYTQTGYDASAHISEETQRRRAGRREGRLALRLLGGRRSAGSCCWRSPSPRPTPTSSTTPATASARLVARDLRQRAGSGGAQGRDPDRHDRAALLRDGLPHQRVAHVLRVLARPGRARVIGSGPGSTTTASRVLGAVHGLARADGHGSRPVGDGDTSPAPFFAVVSITVIGLYIAYVIPIFLRWRMGDALRARSLDARAQVQVGQSRRPDLGGRSAWIIFILPFVPAGVPWNEDFDWKSVNYAPITFRRGCDHRMVWWAGRRPQALHRADPRGQIDELGRVEEGVPAGPEAAPGTTPAQPTTGA